MQTRIYFLLVLFLLPASLGGFTWVPTVAADPATVAPIGLLEEVKALQEKVRMLEERESLREAKVQTLEAKVQKLIDTLYGMANGMFGNFAAKLKNTKYTAETDGFIVVYSGGNMPPEWEVHVGGNMRTRGFGYQGAMSPVRKGQEWSVTSSNDRNPPDGGVTVWWMPVELPAKP